MYSIRACVFSVASSSMKLLALQIEQPLFVHQAARLHIAAAHGFGDAAADVVVVLGDEAAFAAC